jgi:putative transposase
MAGWGHSVCMGRRKREVQPGVAMHVWQRGNHQETVFHSEMDHRIFLRLLREHCEIYGVRIFAYCLMTNHYHLVVAGDRVNSVSLAIGQTNREYSYIRHRMMGTSGQLWEGRFGSSLLDEAHFWTAFCYVERNPMSAGMVEKPWDWAWSSARSHVGMAKESWLELSRWRARYDCTTWRHALEIGIRDEALEERIAMGKIWFQQNPVTRHR